MKLPPSPFVVDITIAPPNKHQQQQQQERQYSGIWDKTERKTQKREHTAGKIWWKRRSKQKKGWYAISKWFEWFISHKVKIIAEKPETLLFSCFFTRRIWNCHTVVTRATMRSERKWEVNESEIQVMIQLRREWADSRWWCAGTLLYKVEWQL